MKTVAVLNEKNVVINIIVVSDDFNELDHVEYFNQNPALIGGDLFDGYFYPKQPYSSWTRNGAGNWIAPSPRPNGVDWRWDEDTLSWIELEA